MSCKHTIPPNGVVTVTMSTFASCIFCELEQLRADLAAERQRSAAERESMLVEIQVLQRRRPDAVEMSRLDGEIARLRAELARVESERDVLRAQHEAAGAAIGAKCVEHVELNGHIEIAEQAHDYLAHEAIDDQSGKLHDFTAALRVVIDQVDRQRRRANWYEAGYTAGKTKLIEHAISVAFEKARAAAIQYAARVEELGLAADDNDPRVMATAAPIGKAQADLWFALGLLDDPSRCAVCAWPLAESIEKGCVRGCCSQRPRPARLFAPERAAKESEDLHERALRNGMPPSGRWA